MYAVNTTQVNKLSQLLAPLDRSSLSLEKEKMQDLQDFLETANLPTTKDENWKYTRLTKLSNASFSGSQNANIPFTVYQDAYRIVFDNGKLVRKDAFNGCRSLTELTSHELTQLKPNKVIFDALNFVYAEDGVFLDVYGDLDKPIEILHLSNGNKVNNIRHYIRVHSLAKAEISLIFSADEESKSFSNIVSEIHLDNGAQLVINKLQVERGLDVNISREKVTQHRDSVFTMNTISLDGQFVRNDVEISVQGVNAESNLNGVYIVREQQFIDNHTIIDHQVPHCLSNELYKGVIFDKATAVFNGKVFVRKDAQKINAFQSNANILMSEDATVNAKPELEIYADDVKCSHGSTTGQLDEEAIFYLKSRGISDSGARNLLVSAFVGQVLEKIEHEDIQTFISKKLQERFGWEN